MAIFSVLDLNKGSYQVDLGDASRYLTSLVVPNGHFQFRELQLGLSTTTKVFIRLISKCFGDLPYVHIYLDDILVATTNEEQHALVIRLIIERAIRYIITINPQKSQLCGRKVHFLGGYISMYQITTDLRPTGYSSRANLINECIKCYSTNTQLVSQFHTSLSSIDCSTHCDISQETYLD